MDEYREKVIKPGDRASKRGREICLASFDNCQAVRVIRAQGGLFRGLPEGWLWLPHIYERLLDHDIDRNGRVTRWVMRETAQNDGAGGKPQFFTLVNTDEVMFGLGWEIITMCADDIARNGGFPAIMINELQAKRVTDANFPLVDAAYTGYGEALRQARLVNLTGETAIMRHSITAFCDARSDDQLVLTWGGTCLGLEHADMVPDRRLIAPGMSVIGFVEPGYRCNGGTFFTELITALHGTDPKKLTESVEVYAFAEKLCVPSQSYAQLICRILGWNPDATISKPVAKVRGIAHITGGGLWEKFGELLPAGVGAHLYGMPKPAEVLLEAQEMAERTKNPLSDLDAYSTFHGGCGMLLVCAKEEADAVIRTARMYNVEAQEVGEITEDLSQEILVQSRFRNGGELSSKMLEAA